MNVYKILKINRLIKNNRVKTFGIYLLHSFHRRYVGIFLDPILGCNLQCKMCYFSDPVKRQEYKGTFKNDELTLIANAFFDRALKLQIGCGAEPSLFQHNAEIIRVAKSKHVPYISLTTNGNLVDFETLLSWVEAGLDEITLSLHGVQKHTYEELMQNGSFDKFCKTLDHLTLIKKQYPNFKVRINYTINEDNVDQLSDFFNSFGDYCFDILQLRPINCLGNTAYNNFSWQKIIDHYDNTLGKLIKECQQRNITCLCPSKNDLQKSSNAHSLIFDHAYVYISPKQIWKKDFNLTSDSFESYSKQHRVGRAILDQVFQRNKKEGKKSNLNYDIN